MVGIVTGVTRCIDDDVPTTDPAAAPDAVEPGVEVADAVALPATPEKLNDPQPVKVGMVTLA